MSVSPLAVIHKDAHLGRDVTIEPFATIAADVVIGDNCWIGSHAIVMDGSRIGPGCKIFPGAIVGGDPQDLKYKGEYTTVELEAGVRVREYCTINKGTAASGRTLLKKNCLIMAYSHIAHDCIIGESAVVANSVHLAGHVDLGAHVIIGGMSAVQQFVKVGKHSFIGGGTLARKDVPPYIKAAREPLSYMGVNSVGLRRCGFETETIDRIRDIYRVLYIQHENISLARLKLTKTLKDSPERDEILTFIDQSNKGLIRGYRQSKDNED